MAVTTSKDVAPMFRVRRRRKKKKKDVYEAGRVVPLSEAERKGGKAMLKAWFGLGLLKRRVGKKRKGAKTSKFVGYKGRTYTVAKKGGRYVIKRKK